MQVHALHQQYEESSVIQLVDFMLQRAIVAAASDIHCESTEWGLRIRYRIDGVLYDQTSLEKAIMHQVISRLKVLAHIDITEKRVPQDGKFRFFMGERVVDLRVSTFPSLYGEKVVVRILDRMQTTIHIDQLGLSSTMLESLQAIASRAQGFFLATGPTGSGKTTSLYALLSFLNTPHKNIITLEDPVEYNVEGITQGQINVDAGFTFEKGMRSLLRQDPDVVMVGEIRDTQTAHIAIQAALTGHLVLSTVHTNDAPTAIMRLMDMAIEPFLINASLTGVLAQRLARKICTHCKVEVQPDAHDIMLLKRFKIPMTTSLYTGKGCSECLQVGYKGRIGIFELFIMSNTLRSLIAQEPSYDALYAQALQEGMITLREDAVHKVQHGIVSLQELARVLV